MFFRSIPLDKEKDTFLKVRSFYKFLVIDGWYRLESGNYIDYLDHTNKYIAIISLAESVFDKCEYIDFVTWLQKNAKKSFPIASSELNGLFEEYNLSHGSRKKVLSFFNLLDDGSKREIVKKIKKVRGESEDNLSYKKITDILYDWRNNFVHNSELVTKLNKGTTLFKYKNGYVLSALGFEDLKQMFERSLIKYYENCIRVKRPLKGMVPIARYNSTFLSRYYYYRVG